MPNGSSMSDRPEKRPHPDNSNESSKRVKRKQAQGSAQSRKEGGSSFSHSDQSQASNSLMDIQQYVYGNYRNYYETRRGSKGKHDSRLDVLDAKLFRDKRVLDIGCNSGNVTIVLAMRYLPAYILGIDLDEVLIRKAQRNLKIAYSLCDPEKKERNMDVSMRFHYFPRSMTHFHGFMPMNVPPTFGSKDFPYNVNFEVCDWMEGDAEEAEQYDTVLAMSITKWIQLHHGDDGIKRFFRKIYKVLKPGGALVLEPQQFSTFERRAKQSEEMYSIFENIQFKPEDYEKYLLEQVGFKSVQSLEKPESESKGFDRPVYVFTK